MAVALKLAHAYRTSATPRKQQSVRNVITPISKAKNKQPAWEMTASEALRVNYVDKEVKYDQRIIDYVEQYM